VFNGSVSVWMSLRRVTVYIKFLGNRYLGMVRFNLLGTFNEAYMSTLAL
jgi:hypothetical protein